MEKVNFPENTFSKHTLNFDTSYFDFLKSELRFLGREIRKSLKEALLDIALLQQTGSFKDKKET